MTPLPVPIPTAFFADFNSDALCGILITERMPVMVWRTDDRIEMLDETGHRVASLASRADRADLPLVAGEGADTHATEALTLLAAAGLQRLGEALEKPKMS